MKDIKVRKRVVTEEYVTLPWEWGVPERLVAYGPPLPAQHHEGTVDITLNQLAEFADHHGTPGFDTAYIDLPPWGDYAVEAVGWGDRATRGGVWPTEKLKDWLRVHGY